MEKGLHLEPIQYYLDFFRFGCPPHGGSVWPFTLDDGHVEPNTFAKLFISLEVQRINPLRVKRENL
jgi:hypothetical protein